MGSLARVARSAFTPPPYPYDRLDDLKVQAEKHDGGLVDLSVGTPCDPAPAAVIDALAHAGNPHSYPMTGGSLVLREAAAAWMERRFSVSVAPSAIAACVGTKELVASMPHVLQLRDPSRDTVLYPAVSYPTYEMGAVPAGCRAVPVAMDEQWRIDLSTVASADAERALCLWVNTPGNPAGGLDDLAAAATWGRARGIPVLSDECYIEFTWDGPGRTILEHGSEGALAVHSLSKRSNFAGVRIGFYAGDPELVTYMNEIRKHAGLMPSGPGQAAAAVALADDTHVVEQRERYRRRMERMRAILAAIGIDAPMPGGSFYLWAAAPDGDAWALTERLARDGGVLITPGELYGKQGRNHVRIALVQPDERLELVARRLGVTT